MDLNEAPVVRVTYPGAVSEGVQAQQSAVGTVGPYIRESNSEGIRSRYSG